jgi:HD-GYP domain-containing protein (c-di-GMP phosphodiesterase class II)
MVLKVMPAKTNGRCFSLGDHARALAVVLREEFGAPFALFEAAAGELVQGLDLEETRSASTRVAPDEVAALVAEGRARVTPLSDGRYQLALLYYDRRKPILVAVGEVSALARSPTDAVRERAMLQGWLQAVADRLRLTDQLARGAEELPAAEPSGPVATAWEALLAMDRVVRRLRIHKEAEKNQQRILEAAFGLLSVEALVWVPHKPDVPVLLQGEECVSPGDCRQLAAAVAACDAWQPPAPFLCNHVQANRWAIRYPHVSNLLAFQVADQTALGWVLALNKKGGEAFRRSDAALLSPFVALLEMHLRLSHRYQDLKQLLVGLARSLTTALDAKDPCTYGHSERVARIAVELGRELGLKGDELGDIYLAGLLHDVGKIGIRDSVLRKPSGLTPEEREHIQQHVLIGYTILADLRQVRNLLPGVLYHHERYDGSGYPDGLAGEDIPLLARILAVADAYDAMSNPRPYRASMPCRRVEEILVQGAGSQWDKRVVDAFLRCRYKIHTIRQRGVGDSLRLAIDGALRKDPSTNCVLNEPAADVES